MKTKIERRVSVECYEWNARAGDLPVEVVWTSGDQEEFWEIEAQAIVDERFKGPYVILERKQRTVTYGDWEEQ